MATNSSNTIHNSKAKDSGGKLIFENATLCSQFLREYTGIEALKNVQPEDIEDMTERYIPMFTEERNTDVVKKVHLGMRNEENDRLLFVITLIEHKSSVDYNVSMQILRYIVFIWEDYEHQMESLHRGISKTKGFKYPPILPIVYYEDTDEWTSSVNLRDRIFLYDVFSEYMPDYKYLLFPLQKHTQSELMTHVDEISLVMLFNRLRTSEEAAKLKFPDGYLDTISQKAPEDVLRVLIRVVTVYLRELNLSEDEIHQLTDQIKERKMGRLFEHFQGYDIQEVRRKHEDIGEKRGEKRGKELGDKLRMIHTIAHNLKNEKSIKQIADFLDEDLDEIKRIADVIESFAPEYDENRIYHALYPNEDECINNAGGE